MKLNKLLELIEKHNIPKDVHLLSDSGWECSATQMNGVYYNQKENTLVFTQESGGHGNYYGKKDWVIIN
ncbi:MAG: hypothetical protein KBT03_00100 [Bacteroidales bacterium]|nr:hypothetical protein [Candidatus Scybalousia scybalohippi]